MRVPEPFVNESLHPAVTAPAVAIVTDPCVASVAESDIARRAGVLGYPPTAVWADLLGRLRLLHVAKRREHIDSGRADVGVPEHLERTPACQGSLDIRPPSSSYP